MPRSLSWLAVDGLAAFRLVILLTQDKITDPLREQIRQRGYITLDDVGVAPRPGGAGWRWLYELIICPWCIGIWVAALVVALTALTADVWQYAACALALSAIAGLLAERVSH